MELVAMTFALAKQMVKDIPMTKFMRMALVIAMAVGTSMALSMAVLEAAERSMSMAIKQYGHRHGTATCN